LEDYKERDEDWLLDAVDLLAVKRNAYLMEDNLDQLKTIRTVPSKAQVPESFIHIMFISVT